MTSPFSRLLLATLAVILLVPTADARPGPGGGGGGGGGVRDRCGSTLSVVLPDGSEQSFEPAGDFLKGMPTMEIDQGEQPRTAVKLADVLQKVGAGWVKVIDCGDRGEDLPSGLPVEGEIFVVVTGRGSLKVAREVRPGVFSNLIQNVKGLRFHAAGERNAKRLKGKN